VRYLSVCSGIEAATVAWHPLGWEPVAFSEIETFPRAVLAHHYPTVPLHGDFTTIKGDEHGSVDVLVGGTPCQDFSVAGLRAGLAGVRGNLTLEFLRLAGRLRPAWIVWENVPGVLSLNKGRAFGAVLGGLAQLGYGFAYRILDAQYFGLAQRRARVFVVGHLGDWRRAAAVLFERESLHGHPAPCRQAGEGIAPTIAARTQGGGGLGTDFDCDGGLIASDVSPSLNTSNNGKTPPGIDVDTADSLIVVMAHGQANAEVAVDQCPTLTLLHEAPILAHALRAEGFDASEDGTGRGTPLIAFEWQRGGTQRLEMLDNQSPALIKSQTPAVAFDLRGRDDGSQLEGPHDTANIRAASGGSSRSYVASTAVRRLTPRECERLQGFPDDYTLIPWRKGMAPDGPRYKALGNSMAVPCMRWLGERIAMVESLP